MLSLSRELRQNWLTLGGYEGAIAPTFSSVLLSEVSRIKKQNLQKLITTIAIWYLPVIAKTYVLFTIYLCNLVPIVLRQHWTEIFPIKCCLEFLGQLLHKIFTWGMLSQEYYQVKTTLNRIFSLCSMFRSVKDNTAYIRLSPLQCCPRSLKIGRLR